MKHLPNNDNQFYPTPSRLKSLMFSKIDTYKTRRILDPSAGKGDLLKLFSSNQFELYAIEIDTNLQKILKQDGFRIVDSDFLTYNGIDKYDLIIMNPPFKNGEKHLLHALNFVVDGQIVCILNAETIKNPYSNTRKDLIQRLNDLNAEIEYYQDMFIDAERSTCVEIALINIKIQNTVEQLFNPKKFEMDDNNIILEDRNDVKKHGTINIHELINDYNREKEQGIKAISNFFRDSYGLRSELQLSVRGESSHYNDGRYSATEYKQAIQQYSRNLKKHYWETLIKLPKFEEKLTVETKEKFFKLINDYRDMEFNENNINILYEHLISLGTELIEQCIDKLFNKITRQHAYYSESKKNIYLYNGWKTNNGYKINKKFILPMHNPSTFDGGWRVQEELSDIEKVFSFFNNGRKPEASIADIYNKWRHSHTDNHIENDLFKICFYKKGTAHFTVKDDALLRRFNVFVGKKRQWLPPDYAMKNYNDCNNEEKRVIDEFEGKKQYVSSLNDPLLTNSNKSILMLDSI
ncbi:DUF4942 domain-containing protein [Gilliamella sp. Bim3-2]|uniref:DUF4942 domain-containing protein n=2 Tax=Gilliamella TaxID=1193503 RepID=UPI00080E94C1|nr:DUF4942 domain-containing protein [Gilliamella apicola]OCG48557.1 hypothetical protein A9G27_00360 [Gilliamella apicola]